MCVPAALEAHMDAPIHFGRKAPRTSRSSSMRRLTF